MIQSNDIRLAVDSGEVSLGIKQVIKSIEDNSAKLVITANKNKQDTLNDLKYITDISNIKLELFKGNSAELGSVCGKPYSVSTLSIINPGDSNILNEKKDIDEQQIKEEDKTEIQEEKQEVKQEEEPETNEEETKEEQDENDNKDSNKEETEEENEQKSD